MKRILLPAILLSIFGVLIGLASLHFRPNALGDSAKINSGDTAWVIVACSLVMLMTPAIGFFYGGMVKHKNVVSIIQQSIVILVLVSLQWVLIGYSLVFGTDFKGLIGGFDFFGLMHVGISPNPIYAKTIPHLAFMLFQSMFAIITPTLIIGAVAERISFKALVVFVLFWTTFIYDPLAHWVWGNGGWLRNLGTLDFAGGTVVHISAGFAGLGAAMLVGKRNTIKKGSKTQYAHNVPFVLLGATLLWFGWFGFNGGSALAASGLALSALVTTNTAAAASGLVWMLLSWIEHKKPSALATATGAVCGLVAITPASGYVSPISSIAIGLICGVVTYLALLYRLHRINIDDTLDVWAAHGIGGVSGAVLTGVFADKLVNPAGANGLLLGNFSLVGVQMLAVLVSSLFAFFGTLIILRVMSFVMRLRVKKYEEAAGLDSTHHGEIAYIFGWH